MLLFEVLIVSTLLTMFLMNFQLTLLICIGVSLKEVRREFFVDMDGVRYRVAKIDSVDGVWYALRRSKFPIPRLGEIGINPRIIQYLGQIGRRHGLILFARATGNGKTTTACSLLQEYLLSYGDVAITIKDHLNSPLNGTHGDFGRCFQIKVETEILGGL